MNAFQSFLHSLGPLFNTPIPEPYRKQFKIKGEFVYPPSRQFDQICESFLEDEKLRTKRKWDNSFKLFLIWFLIKYFESQANPIVRPSIEDWLRFEQLLKIDQHTLKQRWITLINPQMKSTNWLPDEDEFIRSQMQSKNKHIWTQIGVALYERNLQGNIRTPKQIRERWMNYLNPDLNKYRTIQFREQWLLREDLVILKKVVEYGKRWSQISQLLSGRTENQVKNRYKSLIHKICKDEECDEIEMIKVYIRKNQAHCESNKQGIVGKRGRHKKGRAKEQKAERKQKQLPQIVKQENDDPHEQQLNSTNMAKELQEQKLQAHQLQQQQQYLQYQQQYQQQYHQQFLQSQMLTEDGKMTTPLMILQCMPSPGFPFLDYIKGQTPDAIDEGDGAIGSSAHIPQIKNNIYKLSSQSPFLNLPSMLQSPFWQDNNAYMLGSGGEADMLMQFQNGQPQQQLVATTPYLNLQMRAPVAQAQKPKELDFLKQDNPIQQFNMRRNINQK